LQLVVPPDEGICSLPVKTWQFFEEISWEIVTVELEGGKSEWSREITRYSTLFISSINPIGVIQLII